MLSANRSTSGTPARDDAFDDRRDAFEDVRERSWIGVERRELGRSGEHGLGADVRARADGACGPADDDVALGRLLGLTEGRLSARREPPSSGSEPVPDGRAAGVDVEGALAAPLRPEHDDPLRTWEDATPDERLVLFALHEEAGVVHAEEYPRTHRLSAASAQRAAAALRRDVVAELADGSWTISEPLLDEWPDHAAGDRARDREAI